MINYLLESSISLIVFILIHYLLLRNDRLLVFKRFYLLFALAFSLLLPFVEFDLNVNNPDTASVETSFIQQNQKVLTAINTAVVEPIQQQFEAPIIRNHGLPVYIVMLIIVYAVVLIILLVRFIGNLFNLLQKAKSCKYVLYNNKKVVLDSINTAPYSFFKYIYVNEKDYAQGLISENLLNHELAHINQLHTLDIIFIELVHIFMWFNPLVYLYKSAIKVNHEFLADTDAVKKSAQIKDYYETLISFTFRNSSINLASGFNYQLIKKRLKMMTKNKAKALSVYKIILIVPVILLMSFGLASTQSNRQYGNEKIIQKNNKNKSSVAEIKKEFSGVKSIDIATISGNCQVIKGNNDVVKLTLTHHYKPSNTFEPVFKQDGDKLKLSEKMTGSNSGFSDWVLTVPAQINIKFGSASGNISLENIAGKITISTASGTVTANDIKILASSKFTSASGDVNVKFAESPEYDVRCSSASGNVTVDYNNNPVTGTIEMKYRPEYGEIACPFKFDTENETFDGNQKYIFKSVVLKKESPVIKIYTASGSAKLKK